MRLRLALLLTAIPAAVPVDVRTPAPSPVGSISPQTGLVLSDDAVVELIQNSSGDIAHQYVARIAQRQRVMGTPEYQAAAEWIAETAKALGLPEVRIEKYLSDGVQEYLGYRTRRAWTPKRAELWLMTPNRVRLTSYADLAIALCRNSLSADTTAELVDIGSGMTDADYRQDVRGKIVLTSSDPADISTMAVGQRGALGIVSSWSVPEWDRLNRLPGDHPNQVGWRYLPEPAPNQRGTFAFMISGRRAQELRELLGNGIVRLHASVDASLEPGTVDVVTAAIPGDKYPDEEIAVTAHLDEIGAEDNASGSAALLEMARTLQEMIRAGKLPRPLRTIRFLWGPEYLGTAAWLSHHLHDPVKRIASMNMDMLGGDLIKEESVFLVSRTPDATPSYLNAVLESTLAFMNRQNDVSYPVQKQFHILSVTGTRNRLQGRMIEFMAGSDHEIYNRLGVPTGFATMWPEAFYHSSEDTPDKVDPTQLHRAVFLALAAIVPAAYADDAQATALAELSSVYARQHAADAETRATERVLRSSARDLAANIRSAAGLVAHAYRRETAAIRSTVAFAHTDSVRASIEALAALTAATERHAHANLDALARWKAAALGIAPPRTPVTAAEQEAARLFPVRRAGHELTGTARAFAAGRWPEVRDAIHRNEKAMASGGATSLRLLGFADVPAFYANGRRSVLEIRDDVEAEYGANFDAATMVQYFKAFVDAGAMDLVRR